MLYRYYLYTSTELAMYCIIYQYNLPARCYLYQVAAGRVYSARFLAVSVKLNSKAAT
jgi:hypothetical protein